MSEYWERLYDQHSKLQAPFICNIEFTAPSRFRKKNEQVVQKNLNHIDYIGTRSGVETLGEDPRSIDFDSEDFDLNKYMSYLEQRPGSHGLFSAIDENPTPASVKKELESHKGVVWRLVLSLTEEDAKRLDYTSRVRWETALRATVPQAAAHMKIGESNLRWVAAYHHEAGHPHVHLVMWEQNIKRRRGVLTPNELKNVKKVFQNEVFADERAVLMQQKTMARDLIRDISRHELSDMVNFVREMEELDRLVDLEHRLTGGGNVGVSPKLHNEERIQLANQLKVIASELPEKGRVAYKLMPETVKESVNETTKWLLDRPAFHRSLQQYFAAVETMTKQYSFQDIDINKALENARFDLQKRISQVVLKAAVETSKRAYMKINVEKAAIATEMFMQAAGRPTDNYHLHIVERAAETLKIFGYDNQNCIQVLRQWLDQTDIHLPQEQLIHAVQKTNLTPTQGIKDQDISGFIYLNYINNRTPEFIKANLISAGVNPETAKETIESTIKNAHAEHVFKISEKDWTRLTKNLNVEAPYIYENAEKIEILAERKEEIKQAFSTAKLSDDLNDRGYIAFCMAVALKQLDIRYEEREQILQEFGRNNQMDISSIFSRVEQVETNYLRQSTWNHITAALNVDLKYPWIIDQILQLNPVKYEQAKTLMLESSKLNQEELQWSIQQLKGLLSLDGDEVRSREELKSFLDRNHLSIDVLQKEAKYDTSFISKNYDIRNPSHEVIQKMTRVLVAAGLNKEQVHGIISDWNRKSQTNLSEVQLEKEVSKAEKRYSEELFWGRNPIMSKKDYESLCKVLNIKAPYFWEGGRQHQQQEPAFQVAKKLWNNFFDVLERERMRMQAQGEVLQRRLIRQQQAAARRRQHEQD